MARYQIDEKTVVDTDKAVQSWEQARDWNGSNHIGRSSHSQWVDDTLFKTRKGRYYLESCSRIQGQMDRAEWMSPQAATRWLILNDEELPEDLKQYEEQVTE